MDPIIVEINGPMVTQQCAAQIVRTIVELLLYHREQIPFTYGAFRKMVKNFRTNDSDEATAHGMQKIHLRKQQNQAEQTVQSVDNLFEIIDKCFEENPTVQEAMIIFGTTIYTAKESFVVRLPPIDRNHHGHNHRHALEQHLRQIAMKLTLSDEVSGNPNVKGPTNVHVLMKTTAAAAMPLNGGLCSPLDDYKLPVKCPQYRITLTTAVNGTSSPFSCCKHLKVFQDATTPTASDHPDAVAAQETENLSCWLQLNEVVRGFKPTPVKGCFLWTPA
ncbi:uncharacterized protein LOC128269335 [Anopheles cruzii]|uniref:uncharacterized protein LOC128269335 n=1 Tax=Anopheles cruzii TaxID=68878 RepID=UPI0022EC6330|nr:uncharacterized protein LOC128269335 [Anopheles cruzii]